MHTNQQHGFHLRYASLHHAGQSLAFPCDEDGDIDLDTLPERARNNYFAARAMVGREFAYPVIELAPDEDLVCTDEEE